MIDLTSFKYILEIPDVVTNEMWFEFAVRCYNLGLTMSWFFILQFIYNVIFVNFSKLYKRGSN
jgi:hypothetical protein